MVVLALWVEPAGSGNSLGWIDGALDETPEIERLESEPLMPTAVAAASGDVAEALDELARVEPEPPNPSLAERSPAEPSAAEPSLPEGHAPGAAADEPSDWMLQNSWGAIGAEELDGRRAEARAQWVGARGGNAESEAAVERGLRWLAAHQRADGSWHFDLRKSPCGGMCRNSGTETSTTAATAIVLLPFLGAGYTHRAGPYQDTVNRGLYHLAARARMTRHGADLQEGTMYAQGLSAIALCETYAMTRDPALKDLAQQAIHFIVYAQDSKGGGWRYTPGEPGDTTVTGWQIMALKSARLAGLDVPTPNWFLAQRFLNSVQSDDGAQYGYMSPAPRATTSAVGLLCRMYGGWRREHEALRRGVERLSAEGPSKDDMYYNYYATQVLCHWGGAPWERWNRVMRDHLIATQARASHEAGSWHFSGGRGDVGGRLYNTAMAVMTLEVYYRYLPLLDRRAVETEF